jgi:hypothetical protein
LSAYDNGVPFDEDQLVEIPDGDDGTTFLGVNSCWLHHHQHGLELRASSIAASVSQNS